MIKVLTARLDKRDEDDDDWYDSPKLYFWFKDETILDHLHNRYNEPHEAILPQLPAIFEQLGITGCAAPYWKQKAGCECGCSPGFVLPGAVSPEDGPFDVFVDLEYVEDLEPAATSG